MTFRNPSSVAGLMAVTALSMGNAVLAAGFDADSPLPGSAWQLVAIQSMDDAQGTTQIDTPEHFTLHFAANGQATLRLDCNRGMGRYETTPASDGVTGSIRFGPMGATRAQCPPPRLDERILRDLPYVRSYLLKDGRLYLSLMADGGIYSWKPLESNKE